jgi:mannose-1-phosphate guanylyltransferase
LVVSGQSHAYDVGHALPELPTGNLISEPVGRNTAAAIAVAAAVARHRDADAVLGVLPSDHYVSDESAFASLVAEAYEAAAAGTAIVTIGIVPTRPDTGFGYLKVEEGQRPARVTQFVEKPDAEHAARYLAAGNYLWNGGMFFARADKFLSEIEEHLPATHAHLERFSEALDTSWEAAVAVLAEVYPLLDSVSMDYGVMEKTAEVLTLAGDFGWSDVGSWSALADYMSPDSDGNVTRGAAVAIDARNNVLISDGPAIAVVGLDDIAVIKNGNGILVVPKDRSQDVRKVVDELSENRLDEYL